MGGRDGELLHSVHLWHGAHNKAAILVSLFEHTQQGDVEMLYIKETVFGVQDGAQLMDCTYPCLVSLAAASHWPLHMH